MNTRDNIGVPLPKHFDTYSQDTQQMVLMYLSQLTNMQKMAYCIAKDHLGSSFNILKSNGYIEWVNKQNK